MDGVSKATSMRPRREIQKETVQVFCRIRPLVDPSEPAWLRVYPPCHVITTPTFALKNGSSNRFRFNSVFDDSTSQKTLFNSIALPLVKNVLLGRNELLFAYGITGSGKTYTMSGTPQDVGVIPRSLDIIFNSISKYQAKKYIFKPDRSNGFDVQSDHDAEVDSNKNGKNEKKKNVDRIREDTVVPVEEDNRFSVFITYVEIYNNAVYDLLEDVDEELIHVKSQTPKTIREDANHNMFVYGVNEVEARNADEAFELYLKGKKRRKIGHSILNSESSRSHSIFTIRIVQAPLNETGSEVRDDKSSLIVSQLSLVDLAGSERTNRTNYTGQRLREACNINNSLLTLRACLEHLRENQKGAKKMIPYRDSRLTHLFKTFLDGEGHVSIITCISPHMNDYEETLHVMKFAEMSQEVQVNVGIPQKSTHFMEGRGEASQMAKEAENIANRLGQDEEKYSWFNNLPNGQFNDDDSMDDLIKSLEDGLTGVNNIRKEVIDGCSEEKKRLLNVQREIGLDMADHQPSKVLQKQLKESKEKNKNYEKKALRDDSQIANLKLKMKSTRLEQEKGKKAFTQKMMMAQEDLEKKMRARKPALQHERYKESNSNAVNNCMPGSSGQFLKPPAMPGSSGQFLKPPAISQESLYESSQNWLSPGSRKMQITHSTPSSPRPTSRRMELAVTRFRRSRSAENDLWL